MNELTHGEKVSKVCRECKHDVACLFTHRNYSGGEGSGFGVQEEWMETYGSLEDLIVYQKLCRLHIEIGELAHRWPAEDPPFLDFLNPGTL